MANEEVQLLTVSEGQVVHVPLGQLSEHPVNSTIYTDTSIENLGSFIESVRSEGILEPLHIMNTGRIISGHRRFKVAKLVGMETVPCLVRHDVMGEAHAQLLLLEHNVHQRDKTNVERYREISRYVELCSGVRAIHAPSARLSQLVMQRREAVMSQLPPEMIKAIEDDIKAFHVSGAFKALDVAAKKFNMSPRSLRLGKEILASIDRLRAKGYAKEADEALVIYNRSMSAAREHVKKFDAFDNDRAKKITTPTRERLCKQMTTTLKKSMDNFYPLLTYQGQQLLKEAKEIVDRLKFHVAKEEEPFDPPKHQSQAEEDGEGEPVDLFKF